MLMGATSKEIVPHHRKGAATFNKRVYESRYKVNTLGSSESSETGLPLWPSYPMGSGSGSQRIVDSFQLWKVRAQLQAKSMAMASCLKLPCVLSNQQYVTTHALSNPAFSLPHQVRGVLHLVHQQGSISWIIGSRKVRKLKIKIQFGLSGF